MRTLLEGSDSGLRLLASRGRDLSGIENPVCARFQIRSQTESVARYQKKGCE